LPPRRWTTCCRTISGIKKNSKLKSPPSALPERKRKARTRDQKETEDNLKKQRQREIEEYEYKKALEREKAQDTGEEKVRLLGKKTKRSRRRLKKAGSSHSGCAEGKKG
jgi:hypothetical protein